MKANLKYAICGLGLVLCLSGGQAFAQFVNLEMPDEMIMGDLTIIDPHPATPEELPWGWFEGVKADEDHPPDNETLYFRDNIVGPGVQFKVSTTVTTDEEWWDIVIHDDWPIAQDLPGYGFNVTANGADWEAYTAYQLAFTNNSTTDWVYVNGIFKCNWGLNPEDYRETSKGWIAPGATRVVTGYFDPLADPTGYWIKVPNFGFRLAAYYGDSGALGDYHATEFDVTVSAADIPTNVFVTDAVEAIDSDTDCVTVDVVLDREISPTEARSVSVEFTLSPELGLCPETGADILLATGVGSWLENISAGSRYIFIDDSSAPTYTVDVVALGDDCGPTGGGTLFTINLGTTLGPLIDGTGIVTVDEVRFRDCDNGVLVCVPGASGSVIIDRNSLGPLAELRAQQLKTGNDDDGTTVINLDWDIPGATTDQVEIWRKGYGDYPEYDSSPTFVAPVDVAGGWTLVDTVPVTPPAYADEILTRDFLYYAAFVVDEFNDYSAPTITTHGTLNYHLGDVSDGVTLGVGDNLVGVPDITALGDNYGILLVTDDPFNYLDVGPTTDYSVDALPTTDNLVEFEDMVMFAINFGTVSKTLARPTPAAANAITLQVGEMGAIGTRFPVEVQMTADGRIQALSLPLTWDSSVVEPVAMQPGDLLNQHGGRHLVLSAEPGTVDAALFGVADLGICGEGLLATVTFEVKAPGEPQISFGEIKARDAKNQEIGLEPIVDGDTPTVLPNRTVLKQAVPNPFNPSTKLSFDMASPGHARLRVYDTAGRLVATLVDENRGSGRHDVTWDGLDSSGRVVAAGVYLYRLEVGSFSQTNRMVLIK